MLPTELEASWMREALASRFPSAHLDPVRWTRIGEGFGLASQIYRGRLVGGGLPESVVAKVWNTKGPGGVREISFFRDLAAPLREKAPTLSIPDVYYAGVGSDPESGCLLLEDFPGHVQGDCLKHPTRVDAVALARQLAALHTAGRLAPALLDRDWLLATRRLQTSSEWIVSRRREFLGLYPGRLHGHAAELMDGLEDAVAAARSVLSKCPNVILHGDFHFDNVILDPAGGAPVILDWARVCRGPAALELAELVFAVCRPEDGAEVLRTYEETCESLLGPGPADSARKGKAGREILGAALVLHFVTSTCGVARWIPKTEREQDLISTGIERADEAVNRHRDWLSL